MRQGRSVFRRVGDVLARSAQVITEDRSRPTLANVTCRRCACIVKMGKANCPVCLEDIHTSRNVSHIPPCSHLIHRPCFDDLISAGFYACPVCGSSMLKMDEVWESLDEEIQDTPMPGEYSDLYCKVVCRDCNEECMAMFHVLGNKCMRCGSYNTVRAKGGLCQRVKEQTTPVPEEPEYPSSESSGAEGFSNDSDNGDKFRVIGLQRCALCPFLRTTALCGPSCTLCYCRFASIPQFSLTLD
ncbi:RING finger and CHY zinc finger domain-containing protein 1 [Chionoecetes opilio]|uniref:RING finger and CHY zinc finger domain-containing protein 1 n=1 Tax=Chionoecetes opilio TaxID=41210 RepID=A0A8J5CKH5_CHIOP|nr:RING finger and CHY zinc finger domain-containing protein 1 [Chionoecetes opilio]